MGKVKAGATIKEKGGWDEIERREGGGQREKERGDGKHRVESWERDRGGEKIRVCVYEIKAGAAFEADIGAAVKDIEVGAKAKVEVRVPFWFCFFPL